MNAANSAFCLLQNLAAVHLKHLPPAQSWTVIEYKYTQRLIQTTCLYSLSKDVQRNVLPQDASCEDLEVDASLSFLSSFVQTALQDGAAPYISEADRFEMGAVRPTHQDNAADQTHALRFAAYEPSVQAEPVTVRTVSRDNSPVRGQRP